MTMTPAEMDELLERHFAAEMAKDLDALMATLADDAIHDVVGDPQGALKGPDIVARYETLFGDLTLTGTTPLRRLHGPGFLVDEVMCRADAVGQPFGIDGGGRPVEFRLLHVLEMAAGKIRSETVWLDASAVIAQLTGGPA
jgi:ketosteroid isomerase-like protein